MSNRSVPPHHQCYQCRDLHAQLGVLASRHAPWKVVVRHAKIYFNGFCGNEWPLNRSENEVPDVYSTKLCCYLCWCLCHRYLSQIFLPTGNYTWPFIAKLLATRCEVLWIVNYRFLCFPLFYSNNLFVTPFLNKLDSPSVRTIISVPESSHSNTGHSQCYQRDLHAQLGVLASRRAPWKVVVRLAKNWATLSEFTRGVLLRLIFFNISRFWRVFVFQALWQWMTT